MEKETSLSDLYKLCDEFLQKVIAEMNESCLEKRQGIVTPEHLMASMLNQPQFAKMVERYCSNMQTFCSELEEYISSQETLPEDVEEHCIYSQQLISLLQMALYTSKAAGVSVVKASHIVYAMYELEDSLLAYLLKQYITDKVDFLRAVIDLSPSDSLSETASISASPTSTSSDRAILCDDEFLKAQTPIVGREKELEQLTQILCRKDTHNALLVGEMGVGKSTIVHELAKRMLEGKLPDRFDSGKLYKLNLKPLLEGVHLRGDLERRMTDTLGSLSSQGNVIIYIEEMQLLFSAFSKQAEELDMVSLLKPYLDWDNVRFIGSCTSKDYTKNFSDQKRFEKYFQKIEIEEPSVEDSIQILQSVLPKYEAYHGVRYEAEAVDYAVRATSKHLHTSFLPHKAIALLDDAGAYLVSHYGKEMVSHKVDKLLVSNLLAKLCKNESLLEEGEGEDRLASLESRILSKIYGQDTAVRLIVENIQMSKAGLLDDGKPLASFLFVGPTGVGKTEVANVLAKELGVELVRFDMSEYVEQYTVSKLIGSPAGYVGYDEGGLLTEAIRKNPNCVLLLDEIEKAHDSIYNILLQVMDYARLTDNKGNHADFRNVVLIMTSNAGAQYASQASIGFGSTVSAGEAMVKQVKKTFKPEFLNRLTASVVFNDMDKAMAERVLNKKLGILQEKLSTRNVSLSLSEEARIYLLERGFSREYGAREMDRAIATQLKPLLTKEILFGKLKEGGVASISIINDKLALL
ncbi:MAG: AAA family ATPase [Paludibacteraceae bacterium]|nr:AAA family ATPase [Paludibacteraceae bacterium]